MNSLIALKVWADQSTHKRVLFKYDNLTVVQVIPTSKSTDEFLSCCLRYIWLVVSIHDIKLEIEHIRGTNNGWRIIGDDIKCDLNIKYQFYQVLPAYFNRDLTIWFQEPLLPPCSLFHRLVQWLVQRIDIPPKVPHSTQFRTFWGFTVFMGLDSSFSL